MSEKAESPSILLTFGEQVNLEVERAMVKFPDQEKTLTLAEWHAVLDEEVGEVARVINDAPRGDKGYSEDELWHMTEELIQVAAMAQRMHAAVIGRLYP